MPVQETLDPTNPVISESNKNPLIIDFPNVEVFHAGNYNDIETGDNALLDNIEFYKDFQVMADLKITHADTKDERDKKYSVFKDFPFSVGKITNWDAQLPVLYAAYANVFPPIKKAIQDGLLTTHSAEIYYNIKSKKTGKTYRAVISAVSMLPAGEIPALYEEFKPYMYDTGSQEMSKQSFSLDSNDFEYSEKKIYVFSKEKSEMNKAEYEKMAKKYADKGIKCMSYEEYSKKDDSGKTSYTEDMAKKYKAAATDPEEPDADDEPPTKNKKHSIDTSESNIETILEMNRQLMNQNKDLDKKFFALASQVKNANLDRVNSLEAQLKSMKDVEKKESVDKIVHELLRSPEGSKLPVSVEEKLQVALFNADQESKTKYAFSGEKEISQYDLLVDIFNSLPASKFSATKPLLSNQGGVSVNLSDFGDNTEPAKDEIEGMLVVNEAKKYALEKELDFNSFEGREKAMKYAEAKVYAKK